MKDSTKVLLGFAAGIAVSAGLFAASRTDKGKKVTRDLGRRAASFKRELDELVEKGRETADQIAEKLNGKQLETV